MSWAIRKLTGSAVSHCFIVHEALGVECAVEAAGDGVVLLPLEVVRERGDIVSLVDMGDSLEVGMGDLAGMIGHPYDYLGLLGFLWVLGGRKLGKDWYNPFRSDTRLFCSESVVRILQKCKVPGASLLDPESCSPADVLAFLTRTTS